MKQILTILLVLCFHISYAQSIGYEWAKAFGIGSNTTALDIEIDNNGNSVIIGTYISSADFNPGPNEHLLTSVGERDIFILKLDPQGNFLWVISRGGSANDFRYLSIDFNNNIFLTGGVPDSITSGIYDITIEKINPNGISLWTKIIGGTSNDYGKRAITYSDGSIIINGIFGSTVDFDPGINTYFLTANGSNEHFILKLDSNGDFNWATKIGKNGSCNAMATDYEKNIYLSGNFHGTATFDTGSNIQLSSNGQADIFIAKLDSNGQFMWVNSYGSFGDDWASELKIDGSGNIYQTGSFSQTVDFNPTGSPELLTSNGDLDVYILKIGTNGLFKWVKSFGGTSLDIGASIAINTFGDIFLGGSFAGIIDSDPGISINELSSNGWEDIFINKIDSLGNFLWAQNYGGDNLDRCYSIQSDSQGSIYAVGLFRNSVNFDPDTGGLSLHSAFENTGFALKLGETVSIAEFQNLISLDIYPNPNHGIFKIQSENFTILDIEILNSLGQKIQEFNNISIGQKIDLSRTPKGLYYVKVKNQSHPILKKIIIQ